MKIIFCLMAVLSTCNGGISSGYGGNSVHEIEIEPQQLQHVHQVQLIEQGHQNAALPQQQFEIVQVQSAQIEPGYGNGQARVQNGWKPLSDVQSYRTQPQIIKVIHEHAPNSNDHSFGGDSQPQIIKIIEEQSLDGGHGYNGYGSSSVPHQIVQVIEEQSHGGQRGNGYKPNFGGHGSASQSDPQVIFSDPPSIPISPSNGGGSTKSSQSSNPLSSLGSIIPQLFRFLFGGGNSHPLPSLGGSKAINTPNAGKLTNVYGYGGTAKITRGGKLLNSFYNSGRVIESGTLKIASVKKG